MPAHAVALVDAHVKVDAMPPATVTGSAVNVAVGMTLTVAVAAGLVPPGPVQVSVYIVFTASAAVDLVPLAAKVPLQPPPAIHAVAFVEVQVRMAAVPPAIDRGFAVKVAVGTGATAELVTPTDTLAGALVPPAPVHVRVKVVAIVSGVET